MSRRVPGGPDARTAQAIDPLSWFTAPFAPLIFGGLVLVLGSILVVTGERDASAILAQLLAVAVCTSACLLVHIATRPKRQAIGWSASSLVLLISLCGYLLSALNFGADGQQPENWWAPGAVALAIASLAPYVSIRRLALLGFGASVVVGAIGVAAYPSGAGPWSAWSVVVMVTTAPLLAVAASSVFIATVVPTMRRLLAERAAAVEDRAHAAAVETAPVNPEALARLTARVTPFLEQLATTGVVTPTDRAVAGQLARRLRDELVATADASWLDGLARGRSVVVMDPERRADVMNAAQRAALTGLLTAILDTPDTASKATLVELRGSDGGATAVAVSMDLSLPEGRRTMHLAPYYLSLKTAFEGLSWREGDLMSMRFEVPATDTSNG